MTKDEALKLALDALETSMYPQQKQLQAITAIKEALKSILANIEAGSTRESVIDFIKEALAQPEPEYLAFMDTPQRTWVGLTDEERQDIALEVPIDAVSITEAKLKEKNT